MTTFIPFIKPYITGKENIYIQNVIESGNLSGDGLYTQKCQQWLENYLSSEKVLLTHSCTAALEMAAILIDVKEGDEIIMPSYTFVSTSNAFVLRGGIPVFVDIKESDLNINELIIENAITPKTKAIVAVHYAGISCDMYKLKEIASKYNLYLIEDAAQAIYSFFKKQPLGSFGHLSTFSFHKTKNIISGEGGALVINSEKLSERAEIIREKGTNRSKFLRNQVDKYTWVDIGSSYLPSELIAAFLWAQLQEIENITNKRKSSWMIYDNFFNKNLINEVFSLTKVSKNCNHNGHIYYLILNTEEKRNLLIERLSKINIQTTFHYIPLHSSPYGRNNSKVFEELINTNKLSSRIIRLPIWSDIEKYQTYICRNVLEQIKSL